MSSYLESCEEAARAAGQVLNQWRGKFEVREKGPADLVTDADLAAQQAIEAVLLGRYPEFGFLGEEGSHSDLAELEKPYCWIVDPLDGTTNYVHGLPNYAVSIGLAEAGKVIAGVIYDPVFDRCFKAEQGCGAFLNDRPISVANAQSLDEALVSASFPTGIHRDSPEIEEFINVLIRCQAIRRLGSAALNLAYVATGQLDGYWAASNKPWDVAAGVILVQEAGGLVRGYGAEPFDIRYPRLVATCSAALQDEIQRQLARS